ncbi:MAG: hypothetical protein QG652_971 [Pseudomonadota bacterium]|nr:hypothetical protein [Pseudomonadota bacterium]
MNLTGRFFIVLVMLALGACGGAEERKATYLERGRDLLQKKDFEKAQIEFKNVLQIDPKSADGWYYLGRVQESQRKYREAMGSYNSAAENDPAYMLATTGMARIYLFAGATGKAMELAQQVLAQSPDDAEALVVHAGGLYRGGQNDQAMLELHKVLDAQPDDLAALAMLSRIYLDTNQQTNAEALLASALQRNNDDELRMLLVQLYADTRQFALAVPHLKQMVKTHADKLEYRNRLAMMHDAAGDVASAEAVLRAAVSDLPDDIAAKFSLVQFLSQKRDPATARIELEKFIEQDADNAELELFSAQLHLQSGDRESAEKIFHSIITDSHKDLPVAQARFALIQLLLQDNRRIAEARSELAILMKDNPSHKDGMLLRGRLALEESRYEEAINDFRGVLKDQPTALPVIKLLATAFLSSGRAELAEEQLKMALTLAPLDAQLHRQLAQTLRAQKQFDEAIEQLHLAQKLEPQSLEASEILFKTHLERKDYDSAAKLADAIIKEHAGSATGYFLKGMLLQAQGNNRGSIAPLEQALSINPLATEPLNLLTRAALATNQASLASNKLQAIVKQHPEHVVASNLLGEVMLQQKNYDQAHQIFSSLTQKNSGLWVGWRNLAQTELMRNKPDLATDSYRRGIAATGDERLVIALALLHERLRKTEEAIALYEETLKRTPDSVSVRNNLALLLIENRKDKSSRDRALQLVKEFENSNNANSLDTLGWVHYHRGEYDLAIKTLMQAEKIAPGQPVMQYHLAAAYFGKGNHDQARAYLQNVIKAEPAMGKRPDVAQMMDVLKMTG